MRQPTLEEKQADIAKLRALARLLLELGDSVDLLGSAIRVSGEEMELLVDKYDLTGEAPEAGGVLGVAEELG